MARHRSEPARRIILRTAAVVIAAAGAVSLAMGPRELEAVGGGVSAGDADNDLITYIQELVLGTDPELADTDFDGFNDLEELARRTDPLDQRSSPDETTLSAGLVGRVEGDLMMISTLIFLPDGLADGVDFRLGVRIGQNLVELPPQAYLTGSYLQSAASASGSDVILQLQTPYPESAALALGNLSFYATLRPPGAEHPTDAVTFEIVDAGNGMLSSLQLAEGTGGGVEVIFRPLGTGDDIPQGSTPDQLCEQTTFAVGSSGATVTHLVETSGCESGSGSCAPTCSDLAGGTIELLDPAALIGG